MVTTYKKLQAPVQTYLTNPSIRNQSNLIKNGNKTFIINDARKNIGNMGITFLEQNTLDTKQFIKLFTAEIEKLMGLSSAGLKVFRLIYTLILESPNNDVFTLYFNALKALNKWNYSKPTFQTGINELLEKSIIFKSISPSQYFVNLEVFYNGDMITLVQSYELKNT